MAALVLNIFKCDTNIGGKPQLCWHHIDSILIERKDTVLDLCLWFFGKIDDTPLYGTGKMQSRNPMKTRTLLLERFIRAEPCCSRVYSCLADLAKIRPSAKQDTPPVCVASASTKLNMH